MVTIQYVTVVRDDTKGLLKTVNSILNQTYPHIKHLILDGSSKTSLDRLPSGYQTHDPNLVYVQELDLGIYNAMNKWFNSNSKPNLVCWLNAGDILPKEHTASLVARDFLKRNWKWAYGNLNLVDASGQIQHSPNQTPFKKRSFEMGMRWIPHEASYFQLDFLKEVGHYNEKVGVGADQEFLMRAANIHPPSTISEVLVHMELGGAHSNLVGWERELSWQKFRQLNGRLLQNSLTLDTLALPLLYVFHKLP